MALRRRREAPAAAAEHQPAVLRAECWQPAHQQEVLRLVGRGSASQSGPGSRRASGSRRAQVSVLHLDVRARASA